MQKYSHKNDCVPFVIFLHFSFFSFFPSKGSTAAAAARLAVGEPFNSAGGGNSGFVLWRRTSSSLAVARAVADECDRASRLLSPPGSPSPSSSTTTTTAAATCPVKYSSDQVSEDERLYF
jgi:hypothetical protein